MAAQTGNSRKFFVGGSSDGNFTWLVGEQSNSFNLEAEMLETSDKSSEWRQFISGIKGATAEVTVFTDNSSEDQMSLINSLISGSTVSCFVGDEGITNGYTFSALVSAVGETNDNGAVSSRSISLQVTGEVIVS